ncbi:MAG TPA: TetR/AcrR family transcriptional regulator [Solirubrobacteraceae bacterium]|nr:TetR/AcrR family transcriptional regulator [Solirubrobacteraceae bacterium]
MSTPAAPAGRREQVKLANRAAILAAARDVFAEQGYGAAGIRDIVRRTDLAAGTFYNYFPDKESVFRAIVEQIAEEIIVRVRAARRRARTLEQFVEGGFRAYFEFVSEDRATLQLMRRNAGAIRTFFDEPAIGAGTEQLRADLRAAVADGLAPAHDSEYMAAAMVGAAVELALVMVERDPPDVEGATSMATGLFLAGLERIGAAAR